MTCLLQTSDCFACVLRQVIEDLVHKEIDRLFSGGHHEFPDPAGFAVQSNEAFLIDQEEKRTHQRFVYRELLKTLHSFKDALQILKFDSF